MVGLIMVRLVRIFAAPNIIAVEQALFFTAAVRLIERGRLDISSMIYKKAPLEELPDILADGKRRAAGKYIITV